MVTIKIKRYSFSFTGPVYEVVEVNNAIRCLGLGGFLNCCIANTLGEYEYKPQCKTQAINVRFC